MADAAEKQRRATKRGFARAETSLNASLADKSTPKDTIQRRFLEVEINYKDAIKAHDAYIDALNVDAVQEQEEEVWISDIATRFQTLEVQFDKRIKEISKTETDAANVVAKAAAKTTESKKDSIVKLERMKFSVFDGNLRKYPKFKEDFNIHIKPMCDPTQIPFVLKSYLSEELKEDVECLGENITEIWERLDRRFGNESRLVDTILADIKAIQICGNDDNLTLSMIKTMERCYADLKAMGRELEMNNTTIISTIEEKMPTDMSTEWIKLVTKKETKHDQKFQILKELMDEWRNRIEYKIASIRIVPTQEGTTHYTSRIPTNNAPPKKAKCWIHTANGDHPIWRCRIFAAKSVKERIQPC